MDKMLIFSLYDNLSECFGNPFYVRTENEAIRLIGDAVNVKGVNDMVFNHSNDFELYQLGEFNNNDGAITVNKRKVCTLNSLKKEA